MTLSGIQPPDCGPAAPCRAWLLTRLDHGSHACLALAILLLTCRGSEEEPRQQERDGSDQDADDDLRRLDGERCQHQAPFGSNAKSSGST